LGLQFLALYGGLTPGIYLGVPMIICREIGFESVNPNTERNLWLLNCMYNQIKAFICGWSYEVFCE